MVPEGFQLFKSAFQLIALLVAVFALAMAAYPRQLTRWQMHGPNGTTQIEPSRMRLLMTRVMGVVVAGIALLMAVGSGVILP
ncbi:hypothetical protein [Halostella litorea]|uniref:hypothetical protein n=1 Tax=Halostella litorea TaxID=2528831 RepID=UPI00109277A5|nr:hypothetical protein [Halostella litorea]